MTFNDLMQAILQVLPNATFDEDNYGQLIVYTDMCEDTDGNLIPFVETE